MIFRHPTAEEITNPLLLPVELRDWTPFVYLEPADWMWIVEHEGQPVALILTSFAGGLLVIWRVLSVSVFRTWFRPAILHIMDNARKRGCVGYLSMFSDDKPSETQLARIMACSGGFLKPFRGSLGVGVIPERNGCRTSESVRSLP